VEICAILTDDVPLLIQNCVTLSVGGEYQVKVTPVRFEDVIESPAGVTGIGPGSYMEKFAGAEKLP